jgi:hypothetical protein
LVPGRKLKARGRGAVNGPACTPAPGSALGLLLSRALSSAQAGEIVAKKEERQNNGARAAADAPLLLIITHT